MTRPAATHGIYSATQDSSSSSSSSGRASHIACAIRSQIIQARLESGNNGSIYAGPSRHQSHRSQVGSRSRSPSSSVAESRWISRFSYQGGNHGSALGWSASGRKTRAEGTSMDGTALKSIPAFRDRHGVGQKRRQQPNPHPPTLILIVPYRACDVDPRRWAAVGGVC